MKSITRVIGGLLAAGCAIFVVSATRVRADVVGTQRGETEFREHCAECHADGGNIINAAKTLSKADREKNGIKSTDDIIKIMRNPGEGMTLFDEKTVPQTTAEKIAGYIITTFK